MPLRLRRTICLAGQVSNQHAERLDLSIQVEGTGAANSLDSLAAPAPVRPDSTVQPTWCESETGSGTDVTRRKGAVARFNGRFLWVWGMATGT